MKRYFPYIIFATAITVTCIGSFYSVYGIGKLFSGHMIGAIIMATSLEVGNIITTTSLKVYWEKLPKFLRTYLVTAVVILSSITSIGIYGYLSDGYQRTSNLDKITQSKIDLVSKKNDRFQIKREELKLERNQLNGSISELRNGLTVNNQTQTVVNGKVLTNIQSASKKSLEIQLDKALANSETLETKINNLGDSIQAYELRIIELGSENEAGSELGPLKYLSSLTGWSMDHIVNILLIFIMIVFQPLAIALILTAMFAFNFQTENEPNVVETEPEPVIKPKRKYTPRKKIPVEITELDLPIQKVETEPEPQEIVDVEPNEKLKRQSKKRKVVDTTLTPEIAEHIAESLKRKQLSVAEKRIMPQQQIEKFEKENGK